MQELLQECDHQRALPRARWRAGAAPPRRGARKSRTLVGGAAGDVVPEERADQRLEPGQRRPRHLRQSLGSVPEQPRDGVHVQPGRHPQRARERVARGEGGGRAAGRRAAPDGGAHHRRDVGEPSGAQRHQRAPRDGRGDLAARRQPLPRRAGRRRPPVQGRADPAPRLLCARRRSRRRRARRRARRWRQYVALARLRWRECRQHLGDTPRACRRRRSARANRSRCRRCLASAGWARARTRSADRRQRRRRRRSTCLWRRRA